MWPNLLLLLSCLLVDCHVSDGCQLPTEDSPVSMCAFCSDSHAGVKWTVHESNRRKYPFGAYSLDIGFHCSNSQATVTNDVCFHGDLIPGLVFLQDTNTWLWHILGQQLSKGTECVFTAVIKDGFARHFAEITAPCTISDPTSDSKSLIMPAKCSESSQEGCPCHCSDGFTIDNQFDQLLTCKNINECSEGTHHCKNASNCVDTEGSYYCANELPSDSSTNFKVNPSNTQIAATPTKTVLPTSTTPIVTSSIDNPVPTSDFIMVTTPRDTLPLCTTTTSTTTACTITTSTTVCCYN